MLGFILLHLGPQFLVAVVVLVTFEVMSAMAEISTEVVQPDLMLLAGIGFLITLLLLWLLLRKKWQQEKVWQFPKGKGIALLIGALLGIFLNIVLVGVIYLFRLEEIFPQHGELMELVTAGNPWIMFVSVVILAPVVEEIIYRGVMMELFRRVGFRVPVIVVLQALIFGVIHGNWLQGMYAFLLGIFLGVVYLKVQSIWMPILMHITFNLNLFTRVFGSLFGEDGNRTIIVITTFISLIIGGVLMSLLRKKGKESKIYNSMTELVGGTPLVAMKNLEKELDLQAEILVKLESYNPVGSVKDRIAKNMIEDAEKKGLLKEGSVIIEPTSGNTGIGLAAIGAVKGYRTIMTMPETMSVERRNILKAYGAEVVLTDGGKGMSGAIEKAIELAADIPDSFIPSQFDNPANPATHRDTTGPEIWQDTCGEVDIFVAGVGTGGTITGVGEYLKQQNSTIRIYAVEPVDSPVLSGGEKGSHKIQGIGAGFVPEILNTEIYDEVIRVSGEDAFDTAKLLAKKEGILAGISSGAALFASIVLAKRVENKGKTIVVILPDTGERYYSTPLFGE